MKSFSSAAPDTRVITRSLPLLSDTRIEGDEPEVQTPAPPRPKLLFQALLLVLMGALMLVILLLLILPTSEQRLSDARLVPELAALGLLLAALLITRQVLTLRANVQLVRRQREALIRLAEVNAQIEEQRENSANHARELEGAIEHLKETYARVARGDYSVRARDTGVGALHPVVTMLNLMLERIERATRVNRQHEQIGQMALTLAQISRRLEQGDTTAMRALAQPSGTPVDDIARLIARLEMHASELESKLQASQRTIDRLAQFNWELCKMADALGRLALNTQKVARKLQEQYWQLEQLAEAPKRSIRSVPTGFFSNPLPKIFGPIGSGPLAGRLAAAPTDLLPLVQNCVAQAESCWQEARACAMAASQASERANTLVAEIRQAE